MRRRLLLVLCLTLAAGALGAPAALAQDATPPETTASLDPAEPGPGGTYDGPVDVTLSASDPDEGSSEPQTHEVVAQGFSWSPSALEVAGGDTVNWDFANGGHDVCLGADIPPDWTAGECEPGYEELGDFADGDMGGTRTFTQAEVGQSFGFYCSYHMPSMTGTLDVVEGGGGTPGSGVAMTEYRINTDGATGEWQTAENTAGDDPFETTFTVSQEGDHVVEYRSTDNEGNLEEIGSVAFAIGGDVEPDMTPPETTARLEPADPGPGGTYDGPVDAILSATDPGAGASGVDITEYRINTDGATGEWQTADNTAGDDPFETTVTVSEEGDHVVEYRSTDNQGNVEVVDSVAFAIGGGAGEPDVALGVTPRRKRGKVSKASSFTARLTNKGAPAAEVQVCVKAKSRLVKVTDGRCWWLDQLGTGTRTTKFGFKPKRAARGKRVRIQFRLTQAGGPSLNKTATLKVARR
jgi:plastocyanin